MSNFKVQLRSFLEKKPLYSWDKFELPQWATDLCSLRQIEMECPTCEQSRPFSDRSMRGSGAGRPIPELESRIYMLDFTCDGCSSSKYTFFVQVDVDNSKIRKVGQNPPWSINLDKDIEKFLGDDDSEYFKKAKICESQGYGIAAFSYYRRVLENSINKILESLRCTLEIQGSSPQNIEKIDNALKEKSMEDRIKIAKDAIPKSLQPKAINPLAIIYDTLSAGIHRFSEEECLNKSESIRSSLSDLIRTLTQQNKEATEFVSEIKSLNDFNSKSDKIY